MTRNRTTVNTYNGVNHPIYAAFVETTREERATSVDRAIGVTNRKAAVGFASRFAPRENAQRRREPREAVLCPAT